MRRILLLAALLALAAPLSAQEFSSLEERMSYAEFKAAGLEKLSPEELAALNDWLRRQGTLAGAATATTAAPSSDNRGLPESSSREVIVSRILGEFTGWTGNTRFTLENGQVWEQRGDNSRLTGVRLSNPTVTLKPALIGSSWYLQVEGYNATAKVRRIQ